MLGSSERNRAFIGDPSKDGGSVYIPQCYTCSNRKDAVTCKAFPKGIPIPIVIGEFDHTKPFNGDGGVLYAPL